jgi:hypothetical protein
VVNTAPADPYLEPMNLPTSPKFITCHFALINQVAQQYRQEVTSMDGEF